MSFRTYIYLMAIGTLMAWVGWGIVVLNVNPVESGALGFGMFYLTLLMGLLGIITLFELLIRLYALKRRDVVIREVKVSFRHAVWLSLVSILSLVFSSQGWLSWWVLIVFIVVAAVLEYVSLIIQHSRRS
ncbi:MAG: hypothetical protein WC551_02470 [Patescibacteria group bacterium]